MHVQSDIALQFNLREAKIYRMGKMKGYNWHRALLVASLVVLVSLAAGCTTISGMLTDEPASTSALLTYVDKSNSFSISYPQDWSRMPEELLGAAIIGFNAPEAEHGSTPNFTVLRMNLSSEMSVNDLFEISKASLEALTGYTSVSTQQLVVDNVPAIRHIYTINREGMDIKGTQVLLVQYKSGWIITCNCAPGSFSSLEPTFDTIVTSFLLSETARAMAQPVINSFTASPKTISPGQSVTLSWNVSGAETITMYPMASSVGSSGTKQISPTTTATYTLIATNSAGSSTSTIIVTVTSAGETLIGCDPVSGRNQGIDFTWEQLCLSDEYQVQLAKDPGFTLIVFDSGAYAPASSTSPALPYPAGGAIASPSTMGSAIASLSGLEAGHTYYWRVRVRKAATGQLILSPWSEVKAFTIKAGLPASSQYFGTQSLSPNNGCTGYPIKPVAFSWSPLKGATRYEFILAKDAALTDVIAEAEVATTAYKYEGMLDYDTSYFWRVMAIEPVPSDWSATFNFTTTTVSLSPPTSEPELPPVTPPWAWVVIGIGTVLVIMSIILIFKARRV